VVEDGGGADFPIGSRVMFWGAYGAFEDGTYSEWIAARKEDLCLIPDGVDDVLLNLHSDVADRTQPIILMMPPNVCSLMPGTLR